MTTIKQINGIYVVEIVRGLPGGTLTKRILCDDIEHAERVLNEQRGATYA